MTLIVNDTCTGTNGTTVQSHTGETGATWTKHTASQAGDGKIQSNRFFLDSAGGAAVYYYASGIPGSAEYDVQADFFVVDTAGAVGRPRIIGRIDTGAHTWYEAYWDGTFVLLRKVVAGAGTDSGGFYSLAAVASETHTIKLEIRDAAKKVYVDGVERISWADNAITAAGKAGLGWNGAQTTTAGVHLDNLSVNDLAVGGTDLSEDNYSFPMHTTAQKRVVTVFS